MTKVISISENAYKALRRLKGQGESFSDVVVRITKNVEPKSLLEYAGTWTGDDMEEAFKQVLHEREATAAREYQI